MAQAVERSDGVAGRDAATPPAPQILRSGLLPRLSEFQERRAEDALDLGAISGEKLRLLAPFARRVSFDNFPGCTADLLAADDVPSADELCTSLRLPGPFDLVFLWDFLDYIDRGSLRPFLQKIAEACRPGALVYFLVSQTRFVPATPSVLDVRPPDQLVFRNEPWTRTSSRHPPQVVKEMMPRFEIRKLFLLKNGIQEHVFVRRA
jgi:SAM-dependent methyltransferase